MLRFFLHFDDVLNNGADGDMEYYSVFSEAHETLLAWLLEDVGPYRKRPKILYSEAGKTEAYLLPILGIGWKIYEAYEAGPECDYPDRYGRWLEIEDPLKALQLKRHNLIPDVK